MSDEYLYSSRLLVATQTYPLLSLSIALTSLDDLGSGERVGGTMTSIFGDMTVTRSSPLPTVDIHRTPEASVS